MAIGQPADRFSGRLINMSIEHVDRGVPGIWRRRYGKVTDSRCNGLKFAQARPMTTGTTPDQHLRPVQEST
jgi:hypothetical protein